MLENKKYFKNYTLVFIEINNKDLQHWLYVVFTLISTAMVRWGSKFETIKCRTTDISKFQNREYWNNEKWVIRYCLNFFIFGELYAHKIFHNFKNCKVLVIQIVKFKKIVTFIKKIWTSKICTFYKLVNYSNLENWTIFKILQVAKLINFQNFFNLKNYWNSKKDVNWDSHIASSPI